ncbi:MAG: Rne/Rng family ribonuclease [Acidimicrobiia bacterium]|nr:Rne/Rng family ribonuclease [Acidimicrobiia bacterium]
MAWFRRSSPQVLRKSTATIDEERKLVRKGDSTVEIRRVEEASDRAKPRQEKKGSQNRQTNKGQRPSRDRNRGDSRRNGNRSRRRRDEEIIVPPDVGRRQMLVKVTDHGTQIVVMEGPVLVEHYMTGTANQSVVGNVYLARVRNVLPGMEAAFLDFGAEKNGVLYIGDVNSRKENARIEDLLSENDQVVVQVVRDAMGTKGARLTGQPSLAGRYLVLVPNSKTEGISRRLPDGERERLRSILREVKPEGYGVIVRTAALHASAEEIAADIARLERRWNDIEKRVGQSTAPAVVHEEPALLIKTIREHFTDDFRRLLIDDRESHDQVMDYLRATAPDLVSKVRPYDDGDIDIFERYHVDDQLKKALERKVYLPSGGHLVIDRTEALTVIDVNTGRFVGSSNLEETVLHNNLEAAEEIGRQLRLRDIGGIIVIDFIDMEIEKNQEAVLRKLRETLAKDKTRTQVFDVSALGLVELTRKNVSAGLVEQFSTPCEHCDGRGVVIHSDAVHGGEELQRVLEVG